MRARAFSTGDQQGQHGAVRVMFRVFTGRNGGDVIALFPELPADVPKRLITSYQHVGQHGAADYTIVHGATRPATPAEYAPLQRELEGKPYGYTLAIRRRYVRVK